ncbi:hypothetical protein JOC26_001473 [Sporohalobacter salinus]|nr:hypothetical protein [Sporohalobacter salinus]
MNLSKYTGKGIKVAIIDSGYLSINKNEVSKVIDKVFL